VGTLVETMTEFTNLMLAGGVPEEVRSIFLRASLVSLNMKDGGIRLIAVGMTSRRLIAKVASVKVIEVAARSSPPGSSASGPRTERKPSRTPRDATSTSWIPNTSSSK
jgi:hypothetical protein